MNTSNCITLYLYFKIHWDNYFSIYPASKMCSWYFHNAEASHAQKQNHWNSPSSNCHMGFTKLCSNGSKVTNTHDYCYL